MQQYTYEQFKEESYRLGTMFREALKGDEDVDVDEFIEQHASEEYKKMMVEEDKRLDDLRAQGVLV